MVLLADEEWGFVSLNRGIRDYILFHFTLF